MGNSALKNHYIMKVHQIAMRFVGAVGMIALFGPYTLDGADGQRATRHSEREQVSSENA